MRPLYARSVTGNKVIVNTRRGSKCTPHISAHTVDTYCLNTAHVYNLNTWRREYQASTAMKGLVRVTSARRNAWEGRAHRML